MATGRNPVDYPLTLEPGGEFPASCREDFFRKVRRIDATNEKSPRTGWATSPGKEAVRFRQIPHLHFAPSTIGRSEPVVDEITKRSREEIMVYFMGLLGVNGPLPMVLTEAVLARAKGNRHPDFPELRGGESGTRGDSGPAAFIDLFNHRFISFFYRAAVSANKAVDFDRPEESLFHKFIGSFIGLGIPETSHRMRVSDTVALYFSGHFACPTRHAEGLRNLIADYTGARVEVEENVGHWVAIPAANHTLLGTNRAAGTLGHGTMLGANVWDRTMKFRLVLGPLTWAKYQDYEPGGPLLKSLVDLILLYCNRELICELNPVLRKEEVPDCILGKGARLGFSSWLKSGPCSTDRADYQLTIVP